MPPPGDSRRREVGAVALAAGSVLAGLLAYLYIAVGTRKFGAHEFSGVAQLWTIWFFGSSVLTFPLQHWVIQRLRTDGHGGAVRAVLPRLAVVAVGIGAAVTVVTALAHEDLFGQGGLRYPLIAGGIVVGAAAMGLLRGGLAGHSRFVATGLALGGENIVRLSAGLVVIAVGGGVDAYGAAILAGLLVLTLWPSALRFEGPAPTEPISPFAFLGNVAGGTVIAQSVLTGGPVVLSLIGGTRSEVTSLFTALALFRAPYIIALGLAIRVTAHLTDLAVGGDHGTLDRIRNRTALAGIGAMAAGGAGAALIGPRLLRIVFGDDVDLSRWSCAGLAIGSLAALATLGLTLVQMTRAGGRQVLVAWAVALVAGAVAVVAVPGEPVPRVVAGFLAAELVAFALMARPDRSVSVRPRDQP